MSSAASTHTPRLRDPNTDPLHGFGAELPQRIAMRSAIMRKKHMLEEGTRYFVHNPDNKSGVIYTQSPDSKAHKAEASHPECPARLEKALEWAMGEVEEGELVRLDIPQNIVPGWFHSIIKSAHPHTVELMERATRAAAEHEDQELGYGDVSAIAKRMGLLPGGDDLEIYVTPSTHTAALLAATMCMAAALRLTENFKRATALVRPPGHHAGIMPSGFCVYNNAFLAAQAGITAGAWERVAIVDCDIHHCNGTQSLAWHRSDVLVISTHVRDPGFFPLGTGYATELGPAGPAWGTNLNVPLITKNGKSPLRDADFAYIATNLVLPALREYTPNAIIFSMGADIMGNDVLCGQYTNATVRAVGTMAAACTRAAEETDAAMLCVTEGGYTAENMDNAVRMVTEVMKDSSRMHAVSTKGCKKGREALLELTEAMREQKDTHAARRHTYGTRVLQELEKTMDA